MENRFLDTNGCFNLTHSSKAEIKESFEKLKKSVDIEIETLKKIPNPNWDNFIVPLYQTQISIDNFVNRLLIVFVYSISNAEYQEIYGDLYSEISSLNLKILSTFEIIEKIQTLESLPEFQSYDTDQRNYIKSLLRKATEQGTLLNSETKQKIDKINNEISQLSSAFNSNLKNATDAAFVIVNNRSDLGEIPANWLEITSTQYRSRFPKSSELPDDDLTNIQPGPWLITLNSGAYKPFMEYATNRELKKEIYIQNRQLASRGEFDNTDVIKKLLIKRKELAQVLGFDNFLEKSLAFTSATSEQLTYLYESLSTVFKNNHEKMIQIYTKMAFKDGIENLEPWDFAFYERRYNELLGLNYESIKEYFPYKNVQKSIFNLVEDGFSIQIKEATDKVKVWNSDVQFFQVYDFDGTELGGFYIDPYQRAGEKIVGTQNVGAFCGTIRESTFDQNEKITPIAVLSYGFSTPTQNTPSFCSPTDISLFLHEFGHLLSILLKNHRQSSINPSFILENDTIEFESMTLESLGMVPFILKKISSHFQSGESLSDIQVESLKADLIRKTQERAHQLLYITKISLEIYSSFDPKTDDLKNLIHSTKKNLFSSPQLEDDRFAWDCTPLFTIEEYLAQTYMYLWATTTAYTYRKEIDQMGWSEETIKTFMQTLKKTLYRYASVGRSMHALELATGNKLPDFKGFCNSMTF